VQSYLTGLNVPFVYSAFDQTFHDQCIENMVKRGWSASTQAAARIFLHSGVAMSLTAYAHICHSTQIFITIYASLMIYLDDIAAKENLDLLKAFSKDLLEKRSHGHEVFDAIAEIFREIPEYYGDLTGGMILSSSLRFISAIVMEQELFRSSVGTPSLTFITSSLTQAYLLRI
jgi:hypothetical protein